MAINKKILCFLASFSLFYINPGAAIATTSTPTDVSCQAPGTVNVSVSDGTIGSVLVECEYEGNNTVRTIQNSGPTDSISVPNCTINKPVTLVLFNDTHNASLGVVIKKDESYVVKEIIVICNGSHMTVKESFNNSVLAPTVLTNIPLHNTLTMKVTDEKSNNLATAVDIAHNYRLNITGPDSLFLLVESCDAASDSSFKKDLVQLYVDRKPNDDFGVLGTFLNNITKTTEATMVGFRLVDSPVVYLRCVVDVCNEAGCPSLTPSTSQSITGSGRRRRNVDTTNRRVTLSTSFRVEPLFTTSGVNGSIIGDRKYAFIAILLLAKYFHFFR
ncbi:uncharacterized protein LOC110441278 [Mizuhopecten yessoensis]|uniref:uncharacterized protein LOC110441278 n=1 Tax=Mizuhopecten yessoensis TaxID=6573 RepID=UPI000B45ED5B|nr:uncharacterized protein LOC110441278 [Mizuhopecten yessoensis]